MRQLLLIIAVVLIGPRDLPAQAPPEHVIYYVDGSVTGPGTGQFNDPFRTIASALAIVLPHDYVFVEPGVYLESVPLSDFIFLWSTSGPERTVIDATGQPGTHAITVTTLSEVVGFTIRKDDGAGLHVQSAGVPEFGRIIRGNRIIGCPDGGIWCEGAVHPVITENVIADCGSFGVRLENGASPFFTNNTITSCSVGLDRVGGPSDPIAFFANSILWGNTADVQGFSPADLVSCDVGDLSFAGTNGSLSADPLFLDPSEHDYRLRYGSPCVEMADPNYVLPSDSFDNRGYGAWRRMDGDHDGQVETDIGAYERGGLDVWQDGSGVGSQIHLEIDTGPFRGWFLAYGPFGPGPIQPLPTAGSTHPYFWLDVLQYGLFSSGIQGASGRFTLSFAVTTPTVIGIPLPLQALGVEWQSSPVFHFTNADLLVIR